MLWKLLVRDTNCGKKISPAESESRGMSDVIVAQTVPLAARSHPFRDVWAVQLKHYSWSVTHILIDEETAPTPSLW